MNITEKWATLCTEHEGWLRTLAGRYARRFPTIDFDDLLQEGRIAVGRALETYDESKGKFITYLTPWACAYMDVFCKDNCNIVRVSARRWYKPIAANLLAARAEAGPDDTEEDIHSSAIRRGLPVVVSFDAPDPNYNDSENPRTVGDALPAPEPEPRDDERDVIITQFFATLDEADRALFKERLGINCDPQTLEALARKHGICREGVRQRMVARVATFRRWRGVKGGPVLLGTPGGAPSRRRKNSRRSLAGRYEQPIL